MIIKNIQRDFILIGTPPLCIDKKADIMEGSIRQGATLERFDSRFKRNLNRDRLECLNW